MASTVLVLPSLLFFSFSLLIFVSESRPPFKTNTLVLPVRKDNATNLHIANIQKRTPLLSVTLVVDLNGRLLWLNCDQNYSSSTYHAPICHSTQCSRVGTHCCHKCSSSQPRPGCHNNTCGVIATNPLTRMKAMSELAQDVLSIQSAPSSIAGPMTTIPQFVFACSPFNLLQGPLPENVQGIVGLGHNPIALPIQLASHFGFRPQFALCLSSSNKGDGVIFFGNPPYKLHPSIDFSVPYTKLTPLTVSPQGEYYLQVTSISISYKPLQINTSSFSIPKQGFFSMISTTTSYTVLEHSIFNAFIQIFSTQLPRVDQVKPVPPFGFCVNSNNLTQVPRPGGLGAPIIDFSFSNPNATWRIFGANSWVQARPGVSCLGFVDGGLNPRAPVVIGLHQMENYLIQFDLARSRLGFSPSLLFSRTTCDRFNFTSHS